MKITFVLINIIFKNKIDIIYLIYKFRIKIEFYKFIIIINNF